MHWSTIIRNTFSNWTSYVVTLVVGFVLAPVVVHALGNTAYGLWTVVLSVVGYFGLLDLGIRSSVGRFVTRHLALDDDLNVNRTASTAFLILACGGLLALIASVGLATFFIGAIRVEPQYTSPARAALLIAGLNIACLLPLGVFSSVLIAKERYDVISGVTVCTELARAALVVWFLHRGFGLVALAAITLAVTLVQYSTMAVLAKLLHPPLAIAWRYVDWRTCRELFGFGVFRFIWIVANQLIFYSSALVIGIFLGAAAITPYAIASSLINYGRNIVSLVIDTLYPSAARLDANNDRPGLQRLLVLGTRMALLVTLPLCLGLIFLGRQFITLWMGPAYADSAVILMVLAIPQFGSMSQYASTTVLAGMARHRPLAYFALGEAVANVILSVILVQELGLIGVAWGTVIPHLLNTTIVVPLYTLRVLNMSGIDYLARAYLRPILCALPLAALGYGFMQLAAGSWPLLVGEAVTMCGAFGVASYFVCLDGAQRALVTQKVAALLQREAIVHEV